MRDQYGNIYYGSDLDELLAISGAAAYGSGMEIYGGGAEIYGAAAYGAQPSRAGQPHWQQPGNARHVDVKMQAGVNLRRFPLGFATTAAVAAGAAGSASAQPQVVYRPEKLVIPSDIAGSFDLTDVKVGKDSQFVAPGNIPARAFSETAVDNLLSFHGVAISQIITISVINTGGAALIFKGYIAGTAVE